VTTLAEQFSKRIRREGPITFRDWMEAALYDPEHGYYCRRDLVRWGREGDYRTSPERSVLFGSTFARYFHERFVELGSPDEFTVVEVGPGGGHFALSVLETLERRYPDLLARLRYVLDDVSPAACDVTAQRLSRFATSVDFKPLSDVDAGVVFANELLDAFPVHRVTMREGKLFELYVDVNERGEFVWTHGPLSDARLLEYLERFQINLDGGQIIEVNLAMRAWLQSVSEKLTRGFLILVDYGAEQGDLLSRRHGTLRSFTQHQFGIDVLSSPGTQDITSTVDWTAAIEFSKEFGFEVVEFERQDRFLMKHGLLEELEACAALATSDAEALQLRTSTRELILPGGMSESFQVLALRADSR
jgi:SAM-dependent MidA family methyltransferase